MHKTYSTFVDVFQNRSLEAHGFTLTDLSSSHGSGYGLSYFKSKTFALAVAFIRMPFNRNLLFKKANWRRLWREKEIEHLVLLYLLMLNHQLLILLIKI